MADYKLERILKYIKAMVFLTFPYTWNYFSPPKQDETSKTKLTKVEVLWWVRVLLGSPFSETSCWRCGAVHADGWTIIPRACSANAEIPNISGFMKRHKKMKTYDFILIRNRLWGIERCLCPQSLAVCLELTTQIKVNGQNHRIGGEAGLGGSNCHLDLIIHPSTHSLVGLSINFQTILTRSKFNLW